LKIYLLHIYNEGSKILLYVVKISTKHCISFVDRPLKMAKKKMSKKEFDEQFDAFLRDVSSIKINYS